MTMIKVWLREPHQTDDEAIKLIVDESADVSDVLLKVPELLRVQHLKPSEIQAEFNDKVLSNRLLISTVFEGVNEGTLVIKPRPGVVVGNTVSKVRGTTTTTSTGVHENELKSNSSVTRQRGHPPPSPRTKIVRNTKENTEQLKRVDSLTGEQGKPPVARSGSRGAASLRGVGGGTPRGRKAETPTYQRERSITSRATTPKRDVSISNSDRNPSQRRMYVDPRAVPSRFRQEAERVRTSSKRHQINTVCDSFKPQWGKPLCATCNHSKQAHWVSHKERPNVPEPGLSSEVDTNVSEAVHVCNHTPNGIPLMIPENNTSNDSTSLVGPKE
ncbi:uncharacterized protein TM35_000013330 [Trypanosoma theileri]|uniref:Uncharacterized protein n=1 Tax=Trypanosoma theileri TaxID=67003 RepID=A0A1X0P960_9TRYP|nr:uncharacterized protein TM35_000013330 [Trypanosoma theileri]ORC93456.1 hypothetical protein TM35_000013330 [Trypanosoma theileri]